MRIRNDSVFGTTLNAGQGNALIAVPLRDIRSMERHGFDGERTAVLVVVTVGAVAVLGALVKHSLDFNNTWTGFKLPAFCRYGRLP